MDRPVDDTVEHPIFAVVLPVDLELHLSGLALTDDARFLVVLRREGDVRQLRELLPGVVVRA